MIQKELNEENKEIKNKAYELYEKHGFKDGNDFVDWLEAERQTGIRSRLISRKQLRNMLLAIIGILCVIVVILLFMLFNRNPRMDLSEKSLSDLKVMMLVLDPNHNEKIVVFGDTHFGFGKSTLSKDAQTLLDKDVQVLKENPQTNVRMAGYTSAKGSEEVNQ
ncbi:MAG TPA: DUF2934 domain-containing protein, partial [Caldithrix sp.]|nr:DUF2934 domain-containing protein [Caldithrix sp.]